MRHLERRLGVLGYLLALVGYALALTFSQASAQTGASVRLSAPETEAFPQVSLFAAVDDETGVRISGLTAFDFQVIEDEIEIADLEVEEVQAGTRQVFVFNTNADLRIRNTLGQSRFELARAALLRWWQLPEAGVVGLDDLCLITAEGTLIARTQSAAELASELDALTPTFPAEVDAYGLLSSALHLACDPPSHPGMPTTVVFITPLVRLPSEPLPDEIINRARETGTTVSVVLMGTESDAGEPQAAPLIKIAEATGGQFTRFDPQAGLGALSARVFPQRQQYKLTYRSKVVTSGPHQLQLLVTVGADAFRSNIQSFDIQVSPPEVAFIQPTDRILRATDNPELPLSDVPPSSQGIRVLITFPDGYPRTLQRSQLIVDGQISAENLAPPFDTFTWDLGSYVTSGAHILRVLVEDSLGLRGETIEFSTFIEVDLPPRGLASMRPALGSLLTALALLLAGVILAAGLISMGRSRVPTGASSGGELLKRRNPLIRASMKPKVMQQPTEATLIPLEAAPGVPDAIPLTGGGLILGRDPSLTPTPIEDPAVDRLHARIIRQAGGEYHIRDQGSVSGTWVNYTPAPDDGVTLQHGDLISIGRTTFRFQLAEPPQPRTIKFTPDKVTEPEDHPAEKRAR